MFVEGLPSLITIEHPELTDRLSLNGLGSGDTLLAGTLNADAGLLTLDGGDGADTLAGGAGADTLLGGDGDDLIDGNLGADTRSWAPATTRSSRDPGDGSDTVEGQAGTDTMLFNGANIGEQMELSANGNRLRFTRNIAASRWTPTTSSASTSAHSAAPTS